MNQTILDLAQEAGFQTRRANTKNLVVFHTNGSWVSVAEEVEAFYNLVRNQALEDAALVIDDTNECLEEGDTLVMCAENIRSMKVEK